ncbi:MAG: Dps family protein [Bacteroidota bacterium]
MKNTPPNIIPHIQKRKEMNYLGFEKSKVSSTVKELNQLFANYHLYYQNLRNFHWNIKGENFFELHAQFEGLYNDARLKIDEIAERILTLRHRPLSTLSAYMDTARIDENHGKIADREMVKTLLGNHKILIENFRAIIKAADEGTIDMIGGFLENIEKSSWMLDAWYADRNEFRRSDNVVCRSNDDCHQCFGILNGFRLCIFQIRHRSG